MSYGMYTDDPREDSLFRDDELRMQEELDEEIQHDSDGNVDRKGAISAGILMVVMIIGFLIWFFA